MEQKPKILEQVRALARARHPSHKTEDVYHNFSSVLFSFRITIVRRKSGRFYIVRKVKQLRRNPKLPSLF